MRSALGWMILVESAAWNGRAEACSIEYTDPLFLPSAIPHDGLVIGQLTCDGCTTASLEFRTQDGAVEGSFVTIEGIDDPSFFAFQPNEPLPLTKSGTDKATVLYATFDYESRGEWSIRVLPSSSEEPSIDGELVQHKAGSGSEFKCKKYSRHSPADGCEASYFHETLAQAAIEVEFESASQYLYRVTYLADEVQVEEVGLAETIGTRTFEGAPEEVCYQVDQLALDGTEARVAEDCFSTGGLTMAVLDEVYGQREETFESCTVPPIGEEEAWCNHLGTRWENRACNEQDGWEDVCEAVTSKCDLDSQNSGGAGGGAPIPDEVPSGGDMGTDDNGDDAGSDPDESAGDEGGCSTVSGIGRQNHSWWPMLLFLLGVRWTRSARKRTVQA